MTRRDALVELELLRMFDRDLEAAHDNEEAGLETEHMLCIKEDCQLTDCKRMM